MLQGFDQGILLRIGYFSHRDVNDYGPRSED